MDKPRVYLETTVVSYLAAYQSKDIHAGRVMTCIFQTQCCKSPIKATRKQLAKGVTI